MITANQLIEIQQAIGHQCTVSVWPGDWSDGIAIRATCCAPGGEEVHYQIELTDDDADITVLEKKIRGFKRTARDLFDEAMANSIAD